MNDAASNLTLKDWCDQASGGRTVLLVGHHSFRASGAAERLRPLIEDGAELLPVGGTLPEVDEVDRLAAQIESARPDQVAGIGGGLVMDSMKLAVFAAATGMSAADLIEGPPDFDDRRIRTVAIPTTAGSGAEKTPFAVVYRSGVKHSVDHPLMKPDLAIVEPSLTYSMPRSVAAASALDAISHCIESIWSVKSSQKSREIALGALRRLWREVEDAVVGKHEEAMASVAMAASDAGEAIAMTRTTLAHAMSYYLTSRLGVAHGHAVALLLPELVRRVAGAPDERVADQRGPAHLRSVLKEIYGALGTSDADETAGALRSLVQRLGLATSLQSSVDVGQWMSEVNPERLSNNPVSLGNTELEAMARVV